MLRCILFSSLAMVLTSCVWLSAEEFDAAWDADGDGWGIDQDCDDSSGDIYPGAPDFRGDGCDADCGSELDSDGDDWPDIADCDPDDATIYPCALVDNEGDGVDSDCDGLDSLRADPGECSVNDTAPELSCSVDDA